MKNTEYKNNAEKLTGAPTLSAGNTREKEEKRQKIKTLVKLGASAATVILLIIFGTLGWFTMSREVENGGLQMTAEGQPYVIETRNSSGYYKTQFDMINSDAAEWKISAQHNFNNHSSAIKDDDTEPLLEPGDYGSLEFRVSPLNADKITVDCLFEIKAYREVTGLDGNESLSTTITEIGDDTISGFIEGHILLFSGYDSENNKYTGFIDENNFNKRILENQTYTKNDGTYTTIYWYWPEHLSDVVSNEQTKYDPKERQEIINYIARNKNKFFRDCNDTVSKVQTDLTGNYSNQTYNHYSLKYDSADLIIGNNISYVVLSMQVKQD